MNRSEISKKAWRTRKREGGEATCLFCKKPIFAGGVLYGGKKYHKSCLEAKKFGLTKRQAGVKNPRLDPWGVPIGYYEYSRHYSEEEAREVAKRLRKKGRTVIVLAEGYRMTMWAVFVKKRADENPRRRSRDGFYYGAAALNPIDISEYDKMEKESLRLHQKGNKEAELAIRGMMSSFDIKGVTFNPRPPARWWVEIWAKTAAGYPKKAGESLKKYRADISRITAGIWYKLSEATRKRLTKRYERLAVPARTLANPIKGKIIKGKHKGLSGTITGTWGSKLEIQLDGKSFEELEARVPGRMPSTIVYVSPQEVEISNPVKGMCPHCGAIIYLGMGINLVKCPKCGKKLTVPIH